MPIPPDNKPFIQNMSLPLHDYLINASYQTYLSQDQIDPTACLDSYRAVISRGARFCHLDVYPLYDFVSEVTPSNSPSKPSGPNITNMAQNKNSNLNRFDSMRSNFTTRTEDMSCMINRDKISLSSDKTKDDSDQDQKSSNSGHNERGINSNSHMDGHRPDGYFHLLGCEIRHEATDIGQGLLLEDVLDTIASCAFEQHTLPLIIWVQVHDEETYKNQLISEKMLENSSRKALSSHQNQEDNKSNLSGQSHDRSSKKPRKRPNLVSDLYTYLSESLCQKIGKYLLCKEDFLNLSKSCSEIPVDQNNNDKNQQFSYNLPSPENLQNKILLASILPEDLKNLFSIYDQSRLENILNVDWSKNYKSSQSNLNSQRAAAANGCDSSFHYTGPESRKNFYNLINLPIFSLECLQVDVSKLHKIEKSTHSTALSHGSVGQSNRSSDMGDREISDHLSSNFSPNKANSDQISNETTKTHNLNDKNSKSHQSHESESQDPSQDQNSHYNSNNNNFNDQNKSFKDFKDTQDNDIKPDWKTTKANDILITELNFKLNVISQGLGILQITEEEAAALLNRRLLPQVTENNLVMLIPSSTRTDSSNPNPQAFWQRGLQICAVSHQTAGLMMDLNEAKFLQNRSSGYCLRPPGWNCVQTGLNGYVLKLEIISGIGLSRPKNNDTKGYGIDPYVVVEMYGPGCGVPHFLDNQTISDRFIPKLAVNGGKPSLRKHVKELPLIDGISIGSVAYCEQRRTKTVKNCGAANFLDEELERQEADQEDRNSQEKDEYNDDHDFASNNGDHDNDHDSYNESAKIATLNHPGSGFALFHHFMEFNVDHPESSILRFVVLDDEPIGDSFIGQFAIPVACIRSGYRWIPLRTLLAEPIVGASVFVRVTTQPYIDLVKETGEILRPLLNKQKAGLINANSHLNRNKLERSGSKLIKLATSRASESKREVLTRNHETREDSSVQDNSTFDDIQSLPLSGNKSCNNDSRSEPINSQSISSNGPGDQISEKMSSPENRNHGQNHSQNNSQKIVNTSSTYSTNFCNSVNSAAVLDPSQTKNIAANQNQRERSSKSSIFSMKTWGSGKSKSYSTAPETGLSREGSRESKTMFQKVDKSFNFIKKGLNKKQSKTSLSGNVGSADNQVNPQQSTSLQGEQSMDQPEICQSVGSSHPNQTEFQQDQSQGLNDEATCSSNLVDETKTANTNLDSNASASGFGSSHIALSAKIPTASELSEYSLSSTNGVIPEIDIICTSDETISLIALVSHLINDYYSAIASLRETLGYTSSYEDSFCVKDQMELIYTICKRLLEYTRYCKFDTPEKSNSEKEKNKENEKHQDTSSGLGISLGTESATSMSDAYNNIDESNNVNINSFDHLNSQTQIPGMASCRKSSKIKYSPRREYSKSKFQCVFHWEMSSEPTQTDTQNTQTVNQNQNAALFEKLCYDNRSIQNKINFDSYTGNSNGSTASSNDEVILSKLYSQSIPVLVVNGNYPNSLSRIICEKIDQNVIKAIENLLRNGEFCQNSSSQVVTNIVTNESATNSSSDLSSVKGDANTTPSYDSSELPRRLKNLIDKIKQTCKSNSTGLFRDLTSIQYYDEFMTLDDDMTSRRDLDRDQKSVDGNSNLNSTPVTDINSIRYYAARKVIIWNKIYLESLLYKLYQAQHNAVTFLKRLENITFEMGLSNLGTSEDLEELKNNFKNYKTSNEIYNMSGLGFGKKSQRNNSGNMNSGNKSRGFRGKKISFKQAVHATITTKKKFTGKSKKVINETIEEGQNGVD